LLYSENQRDSTGMLSENVVQDGLKS